MLAGQCKVAGGIDMSMADVSSVFIGKDCELRAPGRTALDLTNAEIRALLRLDKDRMSRAPYGWPVRSFTAPLPCTVTYKGRSTGR